MKLGWTSQFPNSIQGSRSHGADSYCSNTYTPGRCILHIYAVSHNHSPSYAYQTIGNHIWPKMPKLLCDMHSHWKAIPYNLSHAKSSQLVWVWRVPNKVEEEIEDWDGDMQKQKELKELELKNNNITIPQTLSPSPHSGTFREWRTERRQYGECIWRLQRFQFGRYHRQYSVKSVNL